MTCMIRTVLVNNGKNI
uniref:Uncharacterized protein n=1 Tax=Moniliophthora roreri TaxID=221103 RepID=A0A0W0FD20_MONRR